jgi:hypothetical protein
MERLLLTGVFTGLALIACAPTMIQQEWLLQPTTGPVSVQVSARLEREPWVINAVWTRVEDDCHWFSLAEG